MLTYALYSVHFGGGLLSLIVPGEVQADTGSFLTSTEEGRRPMQSLTSSETLHLEVTMLFPLTGEKKKRL